MPILHPSRFVACNESWQFDRVRAELVPQQAAKDSKMDDQEITWEVVQQLNDSELSDLLKDEAGLELSGAQVAAIRQFIKIAGDLDSALELVNSVKELKDAA
jgi:hypothetical protein